MPTMVWMDWGKGALRYGPRPQWKGWDGAVEIRTFAGGQHGDLLILDDVLLHPRAVFTVVGEGGEPDATVAFEIRPRPLHPPDDPYLRAVEVKDVRPEVIGIHIAAKPDGRGITTADLRSFALDELTTDVFTVVGVPKLRATAMPADDYRYIGRTMREARTASRGRVTRAELEDVARVYREHVGSTPTRAVQLAGSYSERTAARRVQQARAAGLLPRTTPGKRKA
jgi:hypothetical protein